MDEDEEKGGGEIDFNKWFKDLSEDWWRLELAPNQIKNMRDMVLLAVQQDGMAIQFASASLQADSELVKEAAINAPEALQFANEKLRDDFEVVKAVLAAGGWQALRFAGPKLRADPEVMLGEVLKHWFTAEYVAEPLRSSQGFWRAVLEQDTSGWMAFTYAPECMHSDRELVDGAISNDTLAYKFAHESLKSDREFALEMVKRDWTAIKDMDPELHSDYEIMLEAAKQDLCALQLATDHLLMDDAFIDELMQHNPRTLVYAALRRRGDRKQAEKAVSINGVALAYITPEHRQNREIINEAMRTTLGGLSGLPWIVQKPRTPRGPDDDEDADPEEARPKSGEAELEETGDASAPPSPKEPSSPAPKRSAAGAGGGAGAGAQAKTPLKPQARRA